MGQWNVRGRISKLTGTIIGVVRGSQLISPNGSDTKGNRWGKLSTFSMGPRNVRGRISTLSGTIIGVVRGSQLSSPNGSDSKGKSQLSTRFRMACL
ncbi:hypothetical protein CDAR_125591 [Caerostris darwini]|uniref:Uncharacterized protein n=1 Tax=Caerostris darwini TaxID=1538125 RepID=A0AAV4STH4_9ARAC|nr:hypothetical protein CDAR_125591 [Caerostris darwini]